MLIDVSSGYHNLKLDEQSLYLTFSCPFVDKGTYACHLVWHWLENVSDKNRKAASGAAKHVWHCG